MQLSPTPLFLMMLLGPQRIVPALLLGVMP
jgi:hypothetical protein